MIGVEQFNNDFLTREGVSMAAIRRVAYRRHYSAHSSVLASVLVASCSPGVTTHRDEDRHYLEDMFDPVMHVEMIHHQYVVAASPSQGITPELASREILSYLKALPDAKRTEVLHDQNLDPPLSPREYWAIVLSNIHGSRLEIYASDDEATRERKIRALIAALERN
jgi:hypothetical protein